MKKKTAVFTIVSNNYISYARVLMNSVELTNVDYDRYVILVDSISNYDVQEENFKIIHVSKLGIPDLDSFLSRYDILEANTAVKPWSFSYIFNCGYDNIVYLDPDIEVYSSLSDIVDNLELMLLTPHILDPLLSDYDEVNMLRAGAYNLGFLALSKHDELDRFIQWWKSKLEHFCLNNQKEGYFVDQKWMDLAPSLFKGVNISKDKRYNVAYWNLPERHGIEPVFFHFSGLDMLGAYLSKHRSKLLISSCDKKIRNKVSKYRDSLINNGYNETKAIKYSYKKNIHNCEYSGVYNDDNFKLLDRYLWASKVVKLNPSISKGSIDIYYLYMQEYYEEAPIISVYLNNTLIKSEKLNAGESSISIPVESSSFAELRIECNQSFIPFNKGLGSDYREISYGIWKIVNNDTIVFNTKKKRYNNTNLKSGYNIVGNASSETGVGQNLRYITASIDRCGIGYNIINFENNNSKNIDMSIVSKFSVDKEYKINLFFINGDYNLRSIFDESMFNDSYNIGYWCWETENVPDFWFDNTMLDEIWTISNFSQDAISLKSPIPVIKVMPEVKFEITSEFNTDKYKIQKDAFKFLFIYDSFSYTERKNPNAVIDSFLLARKNGMKNSILIIKTNSNELDSYMSKDIIIINETLSRQDLYALHNCCDCFVSLHRAEGLGFNMMESLYLNKPVIATGWSANVEYMIDSPYLVDYTLVKLQNDCGPYKKGDIWAEPSIVHASKLMLQVRNTVHKPQNPIVYQTEKVIKERTNQILKRFRK